MKRSLFLPLAVVFLTAGLMQAVVLDPRQTPLLAATPTPEPPAPMPSAAVQKLLDEGARLQQEKQFEASLQAAERALAAAREARDTAGEARALEQRAQAMESAGRTGEAIAAWRGAAAAWERAGDGPGGVAALAAAGLLLLEKEPAEGNELVAQAVGLGRVEAKRPMAAAQALDAAGHVAYKQRRWAQCRLLWDAALAQWEKLSLDSPDLARVLRNLGEVASHQSDLAAAQEYHHRSLTLVEQGEPGSLSVATALNDLGIDSARRGDLPASEAYFLRALALQDKLAPGSVDIARTLTNLGIVTDDRGDPAAAREYHERSLALWEKLEPDSLEVALTLGNLGLVAKSQGDLAAAKACHERALALREKLAPNSLEVAGSLNNLGSVANEEGNFAAARAYLQRSLAIKEKLAPNSQTVAATLTNLGNLAHQQGDLELAGQYHQRTLAIYERLAPDSLAVSSSLFNLGTILSDQGDLAGAGEYYQRALAIRERLAPNSLAVASSLNNLGTLAREQGDHPAAAAYFRRALALKGKLAPDSLDVARSLGNLGIVLHEQGDLVAARESHERALVLIRKLAPGSLDVARGLNNLGNVAWDQGKPSEAGRLAREAWQLVCRQAAVVSGDEARQAYGSSTALYAAVLIRTQVALGQTGPAFTTLEEGRAQALQQLLTERHLDTSAVPAALRAEHQAAVAARDQAGQAVSRASVAEALARRALSAANEEGGPLEARARMRTALEAATQQSEAARATYSAARVRADELWEEIKHSAPRDYTAPLTVAQARRIVPPGTLLAAFSVGSGQSYLFLWRAGDAGSSLAVYRCAVTRPELQALVRRFRGQVTDPDADAAETLAAGRELYARLFPPQARGALHGAGRLLLSPDGPLWDVPFAALVTNPQGPPRYLGEQHAITYTQSLALFAQSRQDRPRPMNEGKPTAVVVGNPLFARPTNLLAAAPPSPSLTRTERSFLFTDGHAPAPLPATAQEAGAVARLYGGVPLLGERATEMALRQRIGSADVVHLATHGYLDPARAMSSGVLLTVPDRASSAEDSDDDGLLQAWEIYSRLKLKAGLVVLSACETGRGENVQGEGIVGLTRALQYAGARAVLASQWKVADAGTSRLMVAFHQMLRRGLAKDEALRRAMALVRGNRQTAQPYYWAPFVLTGDPGNANLGTVSRSHPLKPAPRGARHPGSDATEQGFPAR
jgi:CHAT domain-containing protein/Tfp pilus assembly protein PilF